MRKYNQEDKKRSLENQLIEAYSRSFLYPIVYVLLFYVSSIRLFDQIQFFLLVKDIALAFFP